MRKYLLPENGNFYKANLHCHSTVSDGRWTPEEIKERYLQQGYSVVAYTDHHWLTLHNELTDESFVALNGVELGAISDTRGKSKRNCDFCAIALTPDISERPKWKKEKLLPWEPIDALMVYEAGFVNKVIADAQEMGYFITYNHPTWSLADYPEYMSYNGMNAMEICNYGSVTGGHDEHNAKIYNDMLRGGKRLYCIAADDNHNREGRPDSFGGFTMIKAEKLEYTQITDALVKGHFYASEGPLIHSLYYEDGKVFVSTSPVREIYITKPFRNVALRKEPGKLITEACFDVEDDDGYFFITAVGTDGTKAYTNACFLDELLK